MELLQASHMDFSKPIMIYLHGFSEKTQDGSNESARKVRDGNVQSENIFQISLRLFLILVIAHNCII